MNITLKDVTPVKPAAPYVGGKIRLAKKIIEIINSVDHKTYAEPFVGMGGVFLRCNKQPPCEIINDISTDIATFYRVLQHHYLPFIEMLRWQISSREQWDRLMRTDPAILTDMQRAARFLYLQKLAFGGKVMGRNYAFSAGRNARFDVTKLQADLADIHERMAGVNIERLNWEDFIQKYDRLDTLFYLDPPYRNNENDYGFDVFGPEQFELMADLLKEIKGKFILSINDHEDIRFHFKSFNIQKVDVQYGLMSKGKGKLFPELIITNF